VYPAGVVDYLRARHVTANMVTPFELGAFVSWNLFPSLKVSMDGQLLEGNFEPSPAVEFHAASAIDALQAFRGAEAAAIVGKQFDPAPNGARHSHL
jgi:hypothetical protein